MKKVLVTVRTLLLVSTILTPGLLFADDAQKATDLNSFLVLGPIDTGFHPAWDKAAKADEEKENLADHFARGPLPEANTSVSVFGKDYTWREADPSTAVFQPEQTGIALLSINLETWRWTSGTLTVTTPDSPVFFVDGVKKTLKREHKESDNYTIKLDLVTGSHQLFLIFRRDEANEKGISAKWESQHDVDFHVKPERRLNPHQLYYGETVSSLDISPDGDKALLSYRSYDEARKSWQQRMELRNTKDGSLIRAWMDGLPGGLTWSPTGTHAAFTNNGDLFITDLRDGSQKRLLHNQTSVSGIVWSPDGNSLFASWSTQGKKRDDGVKHFQGLEDRWSYWRSTSQIFQIDAASGWIRQLTNEKPGANLEDVHADGKRLLYSTFVPNYTVHGMSHNYLKELNLETGEATVLFDDGYFNSACYGKKGIFVRAGVTSFDGVGNQLGKDAPGNDYDTQLFHFDPQSKKAEPLSKDFDPSISGMTFMDHGKEGGLVLRVSEKTHQNLYLYDVASKKYTRVESPATLVESYAVSRKNPTLLWSGTTALKPQKVFVMNLKTDKKPRVLCDPTDATYRQSVLGEMHNWTFENSNGDTIDGRYYLPVNFDPNKKYPVIVYYYGGTSPVNEQFTGRYPFNLWAAHGYVIYVVQPSGTFGYGQEFSSRHLNAWGKRTAEDIIEGTQKFVAEHAWADGDNLGCIGASYGGFMTMYLIGQTKIYGAAVAHAGISLLHSYWGEGWWGYAYSSVATRDKYPWNDPKLYQEQSPLFYADKIETPLLMVHGDADTNVPVGESQQMYTALKILDKPVELVTVDGENHHILDPQKRMIWWDTILAYFDKELKDQPEWWNALYP